MSSPGKDHLHHRLLALGLSQRNAAIALWTLSLVCNSLAMKLQGMTPLVISVTTGGIVVLLGFTVWRKVRRDYRG